MKKLFSRRKTRSRKSSWRAFLRFKLFPLKLPQLKFFRAKNRAAGLLKEKILRLLKTKKISIPLFFILFLFFFTPLSLQTASQRAERFLSEKFQEEAKKLEERQKLIVRWENLQVSLIPLSVRLEGPRLFPASMEFSPDLSDQALSDQEGLDSAPKAAPPGPKTLTFFEKILDGVQSAEAISVHPSLLSLLFKKQISISKAKIQGGDIAVKNLSLLFSKAFQKKKRKKTSFLKTAKDFLLKNPFIKNVPSAPLKIFELQNANISLKQKEQILELRQIKGKLRAAKDGNYSLSVQIRKTRINEEDPAALKFSALISKNRIFIEEASLKSKTANLYAKAAEALLDSKGLKSLKLKSFGSLPSSLVHQIGFFIGKKTPDFEAFLTYKLDFGFNRGKGLSGNFDFKGEEFAYQGRHLKTLSAKGNLKDKKILIDRGFIKTKSYSRINIAKMELDFQKKPKTFYLSAKTKRLPLSFISNDISQQKNFPIKADLTGSVICQGETSFAFLNCEAQMKSPNITIYGGEGEREKIVSFYGMDLSMSGKLENKSLAFDILGAKKESTFLKISGKFPLDSKKLSFLADGYSAFPEDTEFHSPVPMKGELYINQSLMKITSGSFQTEGQISSSLFAVSGWRLENISSKFQFQNGRLSFYDWKGSPGKSVCAGSLAIDFKKKEASIRVLFPFLDIRDLQKAAEDKLRLPFRLKGTGEASLRAQTSWSSGQKPSFQLKGNFFNIFMGEESFQRISLDIFSKNGKGTVKSLIARKGQGLIESSGTFDENLNLNLDFRGQNLYLEQMETLNAALPLNQSGAVDFRLKMTGLLPRPKGAGEFSIKNAFLYTYPVEDTKMKINIDGDRFLISGNLMNEIFVDRLSGSFSKKKPLIFQGSFKNWDIIKAFSAKSPRAATADYSSKLTGSSSIFIDPRQKTGSGKINIDKLLISKGNQEIKSEKPFSLSLKDNRWLLDPVALSHHNKKTLFIRQNADGRFLISGQSSLGLFSAFLPFLKGLDGDIKARIQADNSLKPSRPEGWIQIENGFLALGALPDFTNIRAFVKINGDQIRVSRFRSDIGGGSAWAKKAILSYNFSDPPAVKIPLEFSRIRMNFPESFLTEGSGKINIAGDKAPYLLEGRYLIHSGNITKNFSQSKASVKYNLPVFEKKAREKKSLFDLKLKLETENPVFINNALIHSSLEGDVNIQGPLKAPLLSGGFRLSKKRESHSITFRGQEFTINSGAALFKKSRPDNPILNIKAQTLFEAKALDAFEEDQDNTTEYRIFLAISGPADDLDFSLSSSPFINEREIISMLALGAGSRYFDANVGGNITNYSYQLLGSFLLQSKLNREFKNTLGLNLDLAPHINENNEPVTKVILKKSWFDRLKTSVSRTIDDLPASDARVKYMLKKNISLTGFWERTEQKQETAQNEKMGFDFEFKMDF